MGTTFVWNAECVPPDTMSHASRRFVLATLVTVFPSTAGCAADVASESQSSAVVNTLDCPVQADDEKPEDCPWAGVARALRAEEKSAEGVTNRIQARLKELVPELDAAIARTSALGGDDLKYVALWGRSSNYDVSQLNQARPIPTVDEPIIDALDERAGLPAARHGDVNSLLDPNTPIRGAITFAGVEHTYGYLFSLLHTPFGYKRARWVRDDIEAGFGLPRGTLGPLPKEGTLFSNLTYFAGKVAFRESADERELDAVAAGATDVAAELTRFDYVKLLPARVEETVRLDGGYGAARTVVLRTGLRRLHELRTARRGQREHRAPRVFGARLRGRPRPCAPDYTSRSAREQPRDHRGHGLRGPPLARAE